MSILSEEDPHTNIEVGARGVTAATTSRTQPREWQKKDTLPFPVLNPNPLYSIVGPVLVAEVEVNDVTTRALLDKAPLLMTYPRFGFDLFTIEAIEASSEC